MTFSIAASLEAMELAFVDAPNGDELASRHFRALQAGQDAGGDRRGRQSATLLIAATDAAFHHNLQIDDHLDPIPELLRVCEVVRASARDRAARPRHVPLRLKR